MAEYYRSIEAHIGSRLRSRRNIIGMSLQQMSYALNVSICRINEYELGICHIDDACLILAAKILGVSIGYFFSEAVDNNQILVDENTAKIRPAGRHEGGRFENVVSMQASRYRS